MLLGGMLNCIKPIIVKTSPTNIKKRRIVHQTMLLFLLDPLTIMPFSAGALYLFRYGLDNCSVQMFNSILIIEKGEGLSKTSGSTRYLMFAIQLKTITTNAVGMIHPAFLKPPTSKFFTSSLLMSNDRLWLLRQSILVKIECCPCETKNSFVTQFVSSKFIQIVLPF